MSILDWRSMSIEFEVDGIQYLYSGNPDAEYYPNEEDWRQNGWHFEPDLKDVYYRETDDALGWIAGIHPYHTEKQVYAVLVEEIEEYLETERRYVPDFDD